MSRCVLWWRAVMCVASCIPSSTARQASVHLCATLAQQDSLARVLPLPVQLASARELCAALQLLMRCMARPLCVQ